MLGTPEDKSGAEGPRQVVLARQTGRHDSGLGSRVYRISGPVFSV